MGTESALVSPKQQQKKTPTPKALGVTYEQLNPAIGFSQAQIKVTLNHVAPGLLQDQHILP